VWISDVTIPDGTVLAPGQAFVKTWLLQNAGSCTWSSDYSLTFVSGNAMEGSTTTINQSVASGNQAQISIALTAPDTEGTFTGYWRLTNEQGIAFGISVYVQIVVSDDASTITPTPKKKPTSTPTASPTPTPKKKPTPTPTTAPTSIPKPTNTPIPIPTDTPTP
jgi:cell division septation protein DedD